MSGNVTREECIADLESLIEKLARLSGRADEVPLDAILLVGVQRIDEDDDRDGRLITLTRNGWQPMYVTRGILAMASEIFVMESSSSRDD